MEFYLAMKINVKDAIPGKQIELRIILLSQIKSISERGISHYLWYICPGLHIYTFKHKSEYTDTYIYKIINYMYLEKHKLQKKGGTMQKGESICG